jgi:hypothetical protein
MRRDQGDLGADQAEHERDPQRPPSVPPPGRVYLDRQRER